MHTNEGTNEDTSGEPSGAMPEDVPADVAPAPRPRELDSAIIEEPPRGAPQASGHDDEHADDLARVQVGARVYAADGAEVAIVEIVSPGHVGIRAGQPGRPIDLPAEAIARVSPDGQRVDITLTEAQIEQFSGADSTGADHLAGQMGGEE